MRPAPWSIRRGGYTLCPSIQGPVQCQERPLRAPCADLPPRRQAPEQGLTEPPRSPRRCQARPGPAHRPRPRRGRAAGSRPPRSSPPRGAAELPPSPLSLHPPAAAASPGWRGRQRAAPRARPGRQLSPRSRLSPPRRARWGGGRSPGPAPAAQRCRQPGPGRAGPLCARSIAADRVPWAAHPWAPSPPRSPPPPTEPPSSSAPSPCQPPPRPSPHSTPVPGPRVTRAPAPPQTWRHWQRSSRSRWTEVSAAAAAPRLRLPGRPARGPPRRAPALPPQLQRGSAPAPQCPGPAVAAGSGDAPLRGAQAGGGRRSETDEIKLCAGRGRDGAGVPLPAVRRAQDAAPLRGRSSGPLRRPRPAGLPVGAPRLGSAPRPRFATPAGGSAGDARWRGRVGNANLSARASFAGKMRLFGGLRGGVRGRDPRPQLARSHAKEGFCVFLQTAARSGYGERWYLGSPEAMSVTLCR